MSEAAILALLQALPVLLQAGQMAFNGLAEITGIYQKANDEKRDLTPDEMARVQALQAAAAAFTDASVQQWADRAKG